MNSYVQALESLVELYESEGLEHAAEAARQALWEELTREDSRVA